MSKSEELVTVIESANNYRRCYHTDKNCKCIKERHDVSEITKEKAQRLDLDGCSWCVDGVETNAYDRSVYEAAKEYEPESIDEVVAND